jgi:uncharacterized protein (TIGR03437 family)
MFLRTITSRRFPFRGFHGLLVLFLAPALPAANVTWSVNNGVFSDGGTVTGSFTVDVDTQTVSSWSFAVAGGNTDIFSPRTYTPANSTFGGFFPTQDTYLFTDTTTTPSRDLRFGPFSTPLTDAGGTVTTTSSNFGNLECFNCGEFRTLTATLASTPADLTVTSTHTGNFLRGQTGATYTITVNNIQAGGPSIGTVTAIDTLPAGMTATSIAGTGWTCGLATLTCTRSDTLDGSASYPAITITLNVGAGAATNSVNTVTVSGGGETNTANDSASDPTMVMTAIVITTSIPNAISGSPYSQALSATGGVSPYVWSATGLPSWLSLSPSGVLSGTPPANFYGTVPFTAGVTDAIGDVASASLQLTVQLPVLLVLQSSFTAAAGSLFSGTVLAIGGLKPYTWSGSGLPSWLSISSSGQITGTPPLYGSAGSYTLTVTVTDAAGNTASLGVPLTVNPAPITISPQSLSPAAVGVAYQVAFSATGGSGKYTWSVSSVPTGFSLSPAGVFSGTAAQGSAGTYTVSITATDSGNASASVNLTLQVNPAPVVITTLSNLPAATETIPYKAALSAQGGTPPYSWSAMGLPSWLSLSPSGSLTGTPPVGTAGMVTFSASVNDSSTQTAQATFQIAVSPADSILAIDTGSDLPPATMGVPYNESLSAHGGTPPYNWTEAIVAPGLSLSSSGVISGTPTAETAAMFTGQVNDMAGASAFQQFNLNIVSPGLSIQNPPALATGQLGVPYMQLLSASGAGGVQLTWSVTTGALPQGITFSPDGILMGTPLEAGNFSFTVSVNNSSGSGAQTAQLHPHATSQSFQIAVQPPSANLILSAGTLSFSAVSGGSAPPSQAISIITASPTPLPFSVTAGSPWVQVSPSNGSTPGNVVVSVNPANMAPGTYSANVGFASPGNPPQTLGVTLSVSAGNPALAASPDSIQISNRSGSSTPVTFPIVVQNTGSGFLSFTATVLDAPWLSLDQEGGVIYPNQADTLTFTASTSALAPGVYRGRIELGSNNGFVDIPVTLTVTAQNRLILSSVGTLLEARQGAGISGPTTQSFTILASEGSTLNWTAQLAGSSNFLTLTTTSGVSTNTVPGTVTYQVDSTGLGVGSYYARIDIASEDAANSPQEFVVVLNVSSSAIPASPNPSPAGLLFVSSASGAPAQAVTVFTSSSTAVSFQAAASTGTGSPWLSVAPLSGQISSGAPAQLTVSVSPSGLAPGVYRGTINVAEGNLAVRGVNVTLIVPASASEPSARPAAQATAGCSPASLVLTYTAFTGGFSTPAAWPGVIAVALSDDCGGAVNNGNVVASFSNGDPPLTLNLSDPGTGSYSSTWVPQQSNSQVTISTQATAAGLQPATATLNGTVTPNLAPVISQNGILHDLNPQVGAALAPGTIVQIFGSQLAAATVASNQAPLPTMVQGTGVVIGGIAAPLFYISPTQVNAQIPFELVPGHEYQVIVSAGNSYTVPAPIQLAPLAPGVARLPDGSVIAQHADFSLVTDASPAQPGEYLVAYLAGMGLTDVQVPDGAVSPSNPLATVSVTPVVTLNGESVNVAFAGLTPGLVGLYQINFQVPPDASAGDLVLQITQQGVAADAGTIAVAK